MDATNLVVALRAPGLRTTLTAPRLQQGFAGNEMGLQPILRSSDLCGGRAIQGQDRQILTSRVLVALSFAVHVISFRTGAHKISMGAPKRSMLSGLGNRSWRKLVCHRQGSQFVRFKSYFLSEHDVTRHQIAFGHETPSHLGIAGFVHLSNVGRLAIEDAVPFTGVTADDVKKIHRVKLRALLLRQPTPKEAPPTGLRAIAAADGPVKSKKRTRICRASRPAPKNQQ